MKPSSFIAYPAKKRCRYDCVDDPLRDGERNAEGKRWFSLRMLQTTNSDVSYVGVEVSMYKTPRMFHVGAGNSICLFYSSGCKAEGGVFYNLTINQQTSSPCSHRETVQ